MSTSLRPIHPFPARMAPSIALDALSSHPRALRVLDPMSGSGTSLVVAKKYGHSAIGFDVDPLAVTLAEAWTSSVDVGRVRRAALKVLEVARGEAHSLSAAKAYPCPPEDRETREFINYWFDETNRRQLTCLSRAIQARRNRGTRTLLWSAFSRMIIAKSASVSLAIDIPHSRPHKVREESETKAFDRFLPAVESVLLSAPFKEKEGVGSVSVECGDARRLRLESNSIDIVVTSPPYLNAIDYLRTSKFSLVWMGFSIGKLREIRASSIGTEVGLRSVSDAECESILRSMHDGAELPPAERAMLRRYVVDMAGVLSEVARVLVPKGELLLVVGDSTIKGTFVKNSLAINMLANAYGLETISVESRPLPDNHRYMPPPVVKNGSFGARMRNEVVMRFRKGRNRIIKAAT